MDAGLEMVETPLEILPGPWHKTNEAGAELQSGDHCHQPLNAGAGHRTLGGLNLDINTRQGQRHFKQVVSLHIKLGHFSSKPSQKGGLVIKDPLNSPSAKISTSICGGDILYKCQF